MTLQAGHRLGAYEIIGSIGAGGMGEVYRARDTRLEREVAIKVLPERIASDPNAVARFDREARAVAALSHPNILAIHDFGTEDGRVYAVTELLHGETLRERLSEGALPQRKAIDLARLIARGLGAAHSRGIVHRDLKPENIFVTSDGGVKILDFGLAVVPDAPSADETHTPTRTSLTRPGTVMGTVGYMSPEQVRGEEADARSDIFSLGTLLYEMLVGRRAFQRDTSAEAMTAILREDADDFSASGVKLSPALASVVHRCMEKRAEERFQSAQDLAYALEALRDASSIEPHSAVVGAAPSARRGIAWPAALIVVLSLGFGAFVAGRLLAPGRADTGSAEMKLTRLTHDAKEKGQPSVAPDGKSFVYVREVGEDFDIFFQRIGGETALNITQNDGFDGLPAFSSSGEQIAFVSERDGDGPGVFVMGATGESVRRLTNFGANPSWYPDDRAVVIGTELIFNPHGRTQISELWRVDVATGERTKIDTDGVDAAQPRVSPHGLRIAFWGLPEGTGQRVLYTVPAAGGVPLALTDDGYLNWNPVWSGDGRWLYFASDRGGWMNIWRMPIDETSGKPGGPPRQVTLSTQRVGMFDVPLGMDNLVLAVSTRIDRIERVPFDIVARKTVGEVEIVIEGSRNITTAVGSPDGRWIVFLGTDPQEDLFVVAADGTGLRRLTNDLHRDRAPRWTGDSNTIVFFSDRPSGRYEIWSIDRDGSGLRQLTATQGENPYEPRISPDGKRLIVHLFPGVAAMADLTGEIPVGDFEPLPATPSGGTMFCTHYSPDGTRLVGFEKTPEGNDLPGLIVYTIADGSYQRVTETLAPHAWFPDSRSLLVSQAEGVFEVDTVTGVRRPVEGVEPSEWFVSGDGAYLMTPKRRVDGDIWSLEAVRR